MNQNPLLIVDDDRESAESLARALLRLVPKMPIETAGSARAALAIQSTKLPNVAIVDLSLNDAEGVESGYALLRGLLSADPTCRVIVLTGHGGPRFGIQALELGASHFLAKPADIPHLAALVRDARYQSELRRELLEAQEVEPLGLKQLIVGESPAAQEIRKLTAYAASTPLPVLITGETGTGKGLCAHAIHRLSANSSGPFVRYQPTFSSSDLVGSELFGHEKGAFTGASSTRTGLLQIANLGTLFLDELDEIPSEIQVALLGALQHKTFRPLGSDKELQSNFRLLCATNSNVEESLQSGKLRTDLYHRISHIRIHLPALRDRREDIPLLCQHVLSRLQEESQILVHSIEDDAFICLQEHRWPGNVRELEATIEGAAYLAQFEGRRVIEPSDMRPHRERGAKPDSSAHTFHDKIRAYKKLLVREALGECEDNQSQAAKRLGIDRSSLRRILAE